MTDRIVVLSSSEEEEEEEEEEPEQKEQIQEQKENQEDEKVEINVSKKIEESLKIIEEEEEKEMEEEKQRNKTIQDVLNEANKDYYSESDGSEGSYDTANDDDDDDSNNDDGGETEEEESEEEEVEDELYSNLSPEIRNAKSEEFKALGNEKFREANYLEAIQHYTDAIKCSTRENKSRSIYYSNRAACYLKQENYENCIHDCNNSIKVNDKFLKSYLRRAQALEKTEKLVDALEDYKKVLEIDGSIHLARQAMNRLPEQIKIQQEKEKEEMIGKAKELGNKFLGLFGLSTDNFQMQQDPNTGSYSINFKQ